MVYCFFQVYEIGQSVSVEQLLHVKNESDLEWVHPSITSIEDIDIEQLLRAKNGKRHPVEGRWNFGWTNKFVLKNLNDISKAFENFRVRFN